MPEAARQLAGSTMLGAIDKLDLRIPPGIDFTSEFGKIYREVAGDLKYFRASEHYTLSGDLRPFGYEAILHLNCRHRRKKSDDPTKFQTPADTKFHGDKLELIDTGFKPYSSLINEIERIYAFRPTKSQPANVHKLEVGRIDLTTDVTGVPVNWFLQHMRVMWKRRQEEWGEQGTVELREGERGQYRTITQGESETIYFGKKPNQFRVYNKTAELKEQYKKLLRDVSDDAELPSFEDTYHIPADLMLTRVERQLGGGRIPDQISTISRLKNLPGFNPFENVRIVSKKSTPAPESSDLNWWGHHCGLYFSELVRSRGLHYAQQQIRMAQGKNAPKVLRKLAPYLVVDDSEYNITAEKLFEQYRESVARQLAA